MRISRTALDVLLGAIAIAAALELFFVDRGHIESRFWEESFPLFWASVGLAGAVGAAVLVWVATRAGLVREDDPYGEEDADE